MADDSEQDLIPVKESKSSSVPQTHHSIGSDIVSSDRPSFLEKRIAEQLSRNELEDQLYRLKDENLELKKTSHKQEDQLKKLSTKMSRLMNERKKLDMNSSPGRKRDLELEETIEQLQDKVRNLEKSNVQLREKLLVAKQQVITNVKRPNPYHNVPPKVQTGRPRSGTSPYAISASLQNIQRRTASTPLPPYVIQLLEEARNELFNMKELVSTQRSELEMFEQENEILKERLRIKDTEFEEEFAIMKSQITQGQRKHVQENLDLIRLHRELKQKNSRIITLQAQYTDLEEKLKMQKISQDRLVKELDEKSVRLQEEQRKGLDLFTELQNCKIALNHLAELQESLKILKKENEVLKENNDQLLKSVLNQEKERTVSSLESVFKEQIASLESSLSFERKEKNEIHQEIVTERDKYQKLNEKYLQLQKDFTEVKNEKDELESKVDILKSEDIDFEELGEALAMLKMKKEAPELVDSSHAQNESDLQSKLKQLESDHEDTIKELVSVREMLMTQYKLNQVAQDEVKSLTEKEIQLEKEYQTKMEEYANLLDIRAAKIQKLEKQLNDIAYGTKKFKIEELHEETNTIDILELNRGENVFEIHIIKFIYSADGLNVLGRNDPCSFLTWNFYEFELQSTPVVKGPKPNFEFSTSYTVKVDDFFLFSLHKNTTTLELHESLGTDYKTLAACQLNFLELLELSSGRLHGTEQLISVCEDHKGVVFGTVHYWVKLHIPMEEAFKLYKEKFKALKYVHSNKISSESAIKALNQPTRSDNSINDLHIKVVRCINLKGRHNDVQPSPFCVYKFYDLPDQDTIIVPASNNPEFSDHRTFPVYMDPEIEKYLRTETLEIYVFDDNDPDLSSYIGKASISLLPLSQDKSVKGLFELKKGVETNGSIEVALYWQHSYQPIADTVKLPLQMEEPIEYPPHITPALPVSSEDEVTYIGDNNVPSNSKSQPVPKPRRRMPVSKPLRTSTPTKDITDSKSVLSSPEKKSKSKSLLPSTAAVAEENKNATVPQPAVRRSKIQLNTVDDFIAYGESFLRSPEKGSDTSLLRQKVPEISPPDSPNETFKEQIELDDGDDEDTMLEKKHEISFEEISDDDKQALSESDGTSSSNDSVPEKEVTNLNNQLRMSPAHSKSSIVIRISSLALKPQSSVLADPNIQMLYVEFRFLDFPLEELETPVAMPKPKPPEVIAFDFEKEFDFETKENQMKLKQLAEMFNPQVPDASWIKFTIVSEPPADEEDLDCEEVGFAYVDLKEIISTGRDIINKDISIYDVKNTEIEIGSLRVSVEAARVLQLLGDTIN